MLSSLPSNAPCSVLTALNCLELQEALFRMGSSTGLALDNPDLQPLISQSTNISHYPLLPLALHIAKVSTQLPSEYITLSRL